MSRVWELSRNSGTELLLLLAIADFADDDGNAYPSVATLATKCRMTQRNANLLLAKLRRSGELEVSVGTGPYGTNRYRVSLPSAPLKCTSPLKRTSPPEASITPEGPFTLKPASPTPEAGFPAPLKSASDKPSLNRQEPNTSASRARRTSSSPGPSSDRQTMNAKAAAVLKPEGVSDTTWADFLALRKAKRAPVTDTALRGIAREAAQAGVSLDDALRTCCERGWTGFKAAWVSVNGQATTASVGKDYSKGVADGRLVC